MTRALLFALALGVALAGTMTLAGVAAAQERPEIYPAPALSCEAPISTCNALWLPAGVSADLAPSYPPDDCPAGYACTCVPSCPECDDCDAQVCVRDAAVECKTACDCAAGLGCFDGQCIAGFAPVYCCDAPDACPAGAMCQAKDGAMGRCPDEQPDPMCSERVRKISGAIQKLIERGSSCRHDSECVQIDTSTECFGSCGAYVNERYARRIGRVIDRLDADICDGFFEDGCPYATPGCLATVGKCVENHCQGVPRLPGPPTDPLPLTREGLRAPGATQHLAPR